MNHNETERQRDRNEQFAQQLLDSYFLFRSPLPQSGYIQENKTSLQIMDDLMPMLTLSTETIVAYMTDHDYSTTTEQDGSVVWAIWRQV
ncbi:MAG: hypothetical protein II826_10880 [Prevotella sp.]|nr:hypothetical protein [Prevotella sp.]MBR0274258.1 hypothetical protein [Bacteroidaceae bacterium]